MKAMSDDHKPSREDEERRIKQLGGRVMFWGRWRVEGVLAVSRVRPLRSFTTPAALSSVLVIMLRFPPLTPSLPPSLAQAIGDVPLKPFVTAEPEVTRHDLRGDPEAMFVVLASDGLFDVMSSLEVAQFLVR